MTQEQLEHCEKMKLRNQKPIVKAEDKVKLKRQVKEIRVWKQQCISPPRLSGMNDVPGPIRYGYLKTLYFQRLQDQQLDSCALLEPGTENTSSSSEAVRS